MAKKYATGFPAATSANATDHLQLVQSNVDADATLQQVYDLFTSLKSSSYLLYETAAPLVFDPIPPGYVVYNPPSNQPITLPELGNAPTLQANDFFILINNTSFEPTIYNADGSVFTTLSSLSAYRFIVIPGGLSFESLNYELIVDTLQAYTSVIANTLSAITTSTKTITADLNSTFDFPSVTVQNMGNGSVGQNASLAFNQRKADNTPKTFALLKSIVTNTTLNAEISNLLLQVVQNGSLQDILTLAIAGSVLTSPLTSFINVLAGSAFIAKNANSTLVSSTFQLKNSTNNYINTNRIESQLRVTTAGAEFSRLNFYALLSGAEVTAFYIDPGAGSNLVGSLTITNSLTVTSTITGGNLATTNKPLTANNLRNVKTVSGASLTLDNTYDGADIFFTSNSAVTLTVPSGLRSNFACNLYQLGTGQLTISGSGATVNSYLGANKTSGQYAAATLINTGTTNVYNLSGNLTV